jgi:prepilin-type N-terminal cleavage/methylation domain-containing protein
MIGQRANNQPTTNDYKKLLVRSCKLAVDNRSFTLIELLVVVALIAVLAVAVILSLNPSELLKQGRDSTRLSDLQNLNKSLSWFEADTGGTGFMGSSSVIYVSIPDTTSTCSNLGLPIPPSGYSYHCVTQQNLQKTDGSGWIPVNFNQISFGKTLTKLPIDPTNQTSTGNYYTYVAGGSWKLTTILESEKYSPQAINDGDAFPGVYSLRTSPNPLTPGLRDKGLVGYWSFDEGSGTTAYDRSGNNRNGILACDGVSGYCDGGANIPNWVQNGKINGAIEFTRNYPNYANYVYATSSDMCTFTNLDCGGRTISFWVKLKDLNWAYFAGTIYDNCVSGLSKGWALKKDSDNKIKLVWITNSYTDCGSYGSISSNSTLSANTWYHIVVVTTPTNFKIYLNGNLEIDFNNNLGIGDGSISGYGPQPNLFISGSVMPYYTAINAYMDDFRVYNRALSDAEIQAIYNATK